MNSPFKIYGKKNCYNCENIKEICKSNNKVFEYLELDKDFKREDFEWFWEPVEIKQFPILEYKGIKVSYHLFNKVFLKEFLNIS